MIFKKLIWIFALLVALIALILLAYIFQPLFLRRNYISRISQLDIPSSAQIVEYRFSISSFGIEPFFAKLKLSQEEYKILEKQFFSFNQDYVQAFYRMKQNSNYESLHTDDIAKIGWRDRLTSRTSIFLVGSSRTINAFLVTTNDGSHFLYVFY